MPIRYLMPFFLRKIFKQDMNYSFFIISLILLSNTSFVFSEESGIKSKTAIVSYMSWYPSIGAINGCNLWKHNGFLYRNHKDATYKNYPIGSFEKSSSIPNSDPISFANSALGKSAVESDLNEIKKAGFDVVAYDMLPDPNPKFPELNGPGYCNMSLFSLYGELGIKKGLKFALLSDIKNVSGDYPNGYQFNESQWYRAYENVISKYSMEDWYWKIEGAPVFFQFGATTGAISGKKGADAIHSWINILEDLNKQGKKTKVFLDVRPREFESNVTKFNSVGANPFLFAPGAPYNFINKFMTELKANNDYIIWPVNVNYANKKLKVFLPPDFSRIDSLYSTAILNDADSVFFNTWNDFDEDTDATPSRNKSKAIITLLNYYNTWFKTGKKPTTDISQIIIAAPQHRFSKTVSSAPKWGGGATEGEDENPSQVIYYWVNLKQNGWVKVGQDRINLPKGVSFGKVLINKSEIVEIDTFIGGATNIKIKQFELESDKPNTPGRSYQYLLINER